VSAPSIGFWLDQQPGDPPPPREHMRWTWRPQRGHPVTCDPNRPPRNGLPVPRAGLYENLGQAGGDDYDRALDGAVRAVEPSQPPEPAVGTPRLTGGPWGTRRAAWAEAVLGPPRPLALCGGCDAPLGSARCVFTCGPDGLDDDRRWRA
jgi:hypothetical protein